MQKKDRKFTQSPIVRNCTYIIVPVVAFVAFKFIGTGVNWVIDLFAKVGWTMLITFVVTSLFWACFYGIKEQRKAKVNEGISFAYEGEEDGEDGVLDVRFVGGFRRPPEDNGHYTADSVDCDDYGADEECADEYEEY